MSTTCDLIKRIFFFRDLRLYVITFTPRVEFVESTDEWRGGSSKSLSDIILLLLLLTVIYEKLRLILCIKIDGEH